MKGFFTASDGTRLAYEDEGEGTPLLCLSGLTRNARDFDDLAAALNRPVRLIRLTYRGRGDSGWCEDYRLYNLPVEARDAIELLDHLGLARTAILGTSRGGLIAMMLAAAQKPRLTGVILNDIGPDIAPQGLERIMGYLGIEPEARTYDQAAAAMAAANEAQFPGVPLARWRVCAERWFTERPGGGLGLRYDARLRDAMTPDPNAPAPETGDGLWPLFAALQGLPVAAIRGANSDLLAPATLARMQAEHPGLVVAEVPDRGHVPFLDEPQALAAINAVLDRIEAA